MPRRLHRLHVTLLGVTFSGWALTALPGPGLGAEGAIRPQSGAVRQLVQWARSAADPAGAPFAVIDKTAAHLYVFDALGRLQGDTPVLLGLARGDRSVPGIGTRRMAAIAPHERTTPAGRFTLEPGRNSHGEDIFWVDYDAAVSLHRVRTANPRERRLERLATPTVADNRISYGCINVPADFYNREIRDRFAHGKGVLYILPEQQDLRRVFPQVLAALATPSAASQPALPALPVLPAVAKAPQS